MELGRIHAENQAKAAARGAVSAETPRSAHHFLGALLRFFNLQR